MSDNLGRFIWYELLTNNPDAARSFYQELIGWGHMTWDEGEKPYEMFTDGEQPCAGLLELPEEAQAAGAPSNWLGYVYVPDREAAVEKALELGATKMAEIDVPDIGRFAVLQDPHGAMLAVYTPENEPAPEEEPAPGRVSWHELMTTDYEAAFDFYSKMFGWELIQDMDMGEAGTYRIFGRDGRQLGGMMNRPAEMPVSAWTYYVAVPDADAGAERIQELGGQLFAGPMEVPGGDRIAMGVDPTGAMFAIHARGEQSPEA